MINLFILALAPICIITAYIYIRDKYEKEPISLLLIGLFYGIIIVVPITFMENFMILFIPNKGLIIEHMYLSFMVAALVEEFFKFCILFCLVWNNNNFNEKFDGIVYATFISLGFASIENILYVFNPLLGGVNTAIARAVFSVPSHAIFGIAMGYYFSLAKFEEDKKYYLLLYAFFVPWFLHGSYDFILTCNFKYFMFIFLIYIIYLWVKSFRRIKKHIEASPFK